MALMQGYVPSNSGIMVPDPLKQTPRPGNWRIKRTVSRSTGRERYPIKGVKRIDNTENPLALGSRVFEADRISDGADSVSPNAGQNRGIVNIVAMAIQDGSMDISDLDPTMRRRVEKKLRNL